MKIMLADDYAPLRSTLQAWLTQEPTFEVIAEVAEAARLLPAAATLQPDVLLLDWELQGLRADTIRQQVIVKLHAQSPHLRIVAMSTQFEAKQQALSAGADAFVSKSESPERLLLVLHKFSQGRLLTS